MQGADKVRIIAVPDRCGWCEQIIDRIVSRYAVDSYYARDTEYGHKTGTQVQNVSIMLCEECGRKAAHNVFTSPDQSR